MMTRLFFGTLGVVTACLVIAAAIVLIYGTMSAVLDERVQVYIPRCL